MKEVATPKTGDGCSIVLAGAAGQGINSIESILVAVAARSGLHVFSSKEFMSRVRGGINSIEIRIGPRPVAAFLERIDILCALVPGAVERLRRRIKPGTLLIGDRAQVKAEGLVDISFGSLASEIGNALYAGTVAAGVVAGILGIDEAISLAAVESSFAGKDEKLRAGNAEAMRRGLALGAGLREKAPAAALSMKPDPAFAGRSILSGAEAVAMGAVAGGCDYVCAYPMSPATSVLELMAEHAKKFDILVEQVEDEIGVINMAVGAGYAGAKPMVTTSGGGFALMGEGISLAGMMELPVVIHLAQRPGPATGLPTRTEQGDLFLALHAGHGDFARILLSPGDLEAGYRLGRQAQELAQKWQSPVILMTDQYFVDSYYDTGAFDLSGAGAGAPGPLESANAKSYTVPAPAGYRRYSLAGSDADGLSPRALPGSGPGIVRADSDEHDEDGLITESEEIRNAMVAKRLRKIEAIRRAAPEPRLFGPERAELLVVGWGSTKNAILEAIGRMGAERASLLHFEWLWPLPPGFERRLREAGSVLLVENNATGQLGRLIRAESGFSIGQRLLKSSGMPFSVEEIEAGIRRALEGKANDGD
jgi:2-oxoglutarate ferredoxin oxidoreductase subunit alpha